MSNQDQKPSIDYMSPLFDCIRKLDESRFNTCDWWYQYNCAKLILRDLALDVIAAESRDTHPDRRSADFKQVSQDMTEDMWGIKDAGRNWIKCPKCNLLSPDIGNCINCIAIEAGHTPNLEWFKSLEDSQE